MVIRTLAVLMTVVLVLSGCQTPDSALREQGKSEAYLTGFHDGRHSGMQEAGNFLEHFVQDQARFESDQDYREGWIAGEAEGKRIQQQADASVGVYSSYKLGNELDKATDYEKIGKDAVKGVDTSSIEALEKQ